jgi:predicted enzyme related to lactoylglutathione lyase
MASMRLAKAILYVKDLDRMTRFYEDLLRLPCVPETRTASWAEFGTSGAGFGLHAIPAHIAEQIRISSPPQPREETPIKLLFAVTDPAGLQQRLAAHGVQLIERPWGTFDGVDPEGNVFGLEPV